MKTQVLAPRPSRNRGRRLVAATVLTAGIATGAIAFAGPAGAIGTSYISSNSGGANLRTCSDTGCASIAYLWNGTHVQMTCWLSGQTVSPPNSNYTSDRWFRVNSDYGSGYVHSSLVAAQTSVGHC